MVTMTAFYKTEAGQIIKIFDQGDDWQVKSNVSERWFGQWSKDRKGSLISAITRFLKDHHRELFQPEKLVIC